MLDVNNRPIWQVVKGGSHSYLKAFEKKNNEKFNLSSPVICNLEDNVDVKIKTEISEEVFDEAIIATHSDQALK